MKSPQGKSRNTIEHTFQNAGHQSPNVIIDLQRCKLTDNEALKDIEYHYNISKRIKRVKVITKDKEIYQRALAIYQLMVDIYKFPKRFALVF